MNLIISIAVVVLIFVIVTFIRDKNELETNIQKSGGIRTIYKQLIDFLSNGPKENVQIKDYGNYLKVLIVTKSIRTTYTITMGFNSVMVEVIMDYGQFGKIKNKWTFNNKQFTQEAMITTISTYMQSAQDRLHNSII